MKAPADEASLPAAVDDLYRAVGVLVDPRKELFNGSVLAAPSLYETLVSEIPASAGDYVGRFNGKSRPPCWVDALDLRNAIDTRVKEWQPKESSTPLRLRALTSKRWRPKDARLIRDHANDLQHWAVSIKALIEPRHVKDISAACPSCGKRWHYRNSAGENVRTPALQLVIDTGCTCQSCGAFWPPERYLWLVRLLGFKLPAGLLA